MLVRPLHPIPRPTLPIPTASFGASSSKAKAAAAAAAAAAPKFDKDGKPLVVKKKKTGKRSDSAPSRARKVVVDPRRYERVHLAGDMLDPGMDIGAGGEAIWVCTEPDEATGKVTWVAADGRAEEVLVGRRERLKEVLRTLSSGEEHFDRIRAEETRRADVVAAREEGEADDDDEGEDNWPSLGPTTDAAAALFAADDDDEADDDEDDDDEEDEDDFPALLPEGERAPSPLFDTTEETSVSAVAAAVIPAAAAAAAADKDLPPHMMVAPAPALVAAPKPVAIAAPLAAPRAAAVPKAVAVPGNAKYVPAPPSRETTGPADPTLRAPSQPSQIRPAARTAPAAPVAAGVNVKPPKGKKAAAAVDPELAALVAAERQRGLGVFASLFGDDDDAGEAGVDDRLEKLGAVSFLDDEDNDSVASAIKLAAPTLPAWAYDDSDSETETAAAPAPVAAVAAPVKVTKPVGKPKPATAPIAAASPTKKQVTFDASVPVPPSPSPEPDLDTVMADSAGEESEEEVELDPVQQAMKELRDWELAQDAKRLAAEGLAATTEDGDVLRIRGGARDDDSSEDESESETADAPARKKTDVGQLKAMFAPRTTEGACPLDRIISTMRQEADRRRSFCFRAAAPTFSLLGGLDIDIDDEEDPTLSAALPTRRSPPPFQAQQQQQQASTGAYVHPSRAFAPGLASMPLAPVAVPGPSLLPLGKQPFRPDAATPYFFSDLHLTEAEAAKGPKQQSRSLLVLEHEKRFNTGCGGFWRPEGEDEAVMQAKWEEVKGVLTKDWKARAKGAKRKGRGTNKGGEDEPAGESK